MAKSVVFIFAILAFCWQVTAKNKYYNYTLLQITPRNGQQLRALKYFFSTNFDTSGEIDVLKRSYGPKYDTDVLVSPRMRKLIVRFVRSHDMPIKFKNHYGRFLESGTNKTKLTEGYNFFDYNSYDAMFRRVQYFKKHRGRIVKLQCLGKSYEKRKMSLVKISADHKAGNPVIFIEAGTHAREWVAHAMAMYLIDRLTMTSESRMALCGVDWYILPVANPDGYEYSRLHPSHRMWRKTRSKTKVKGCFGVDLNRNYDFKWGVSGVTFDPCDPSIYAGPKPFSEPEARKVRDVMKKYSKRIKLYVSIHTYGHLLLYPWGYDTSLPPEWKSLHELAISVSNAIKRAGGPPLKVMSAGQFYPAAGASDDYAFGVVKIPYSYTLELTDGHQFALPSRLLNTVLPQYYEGFKEFGRQIQKMYSKECVPGV